MKTIILIIFIYKYIKADNLITQPSLYFKNKYGGYVNNDQQYLQNRPNTFLVRPPLHISNFGPEYAEGAIQQQMPPPNLDGIGIQTAESIGNIGPADDVENDIGHNRVGAFLDRMSSRNSPIGFERQQAHTPSNNWKEAERQLTPFNSHGRTNTPSLIGGNWEMTTSGDNRINYFSNRFNKIIILLLTLLLLIN